MGLERLIELLPRSDNREDRQKPHVYLIIAGDSVLSAGFSLAEKLKDELPQLRLVMHCGGGSFKSQFKKADKSGADIALILGEDELEKQTIGLKPLRRESGQIELSWDKLRDALRLELKL